MIKLQPRPNAPISLGAQKVSDSLDKLRVIINSGEESSSSNPNDYPSHWLPEARHTLFLHQKRKCCYCQREREEIRESDLEHFRPKAKVHDENHSGYWWLTYSWNNYLFSCKPCNQGHKGTKFPLLQGGVRAINEGDDLNLELPVLIDPYTEDPELLISFDWGDSVNMYVKAVGHPENDIDDRGKKTIDILGLNRDTLPEERAGFLSNLENIAMAMNAGQHGGLQPLIDRAAEDIKRATSSNKTFSGFSRAFFRKMHMAEYIAND